MSLFISCESIVRAYGCNVMIAPYRIHRYVTGHGAKRMAKYSSLQVGGAVTGVNE